MFQNDKLERQELITRTTTLFKEGSFNSISLAYLLNEIVEKGIFRDLGFTSFGKWVDSISGGTLSRPHAYALARVARSFPTLEAILKIFLENNKTTLKQLIKYSGYITSGKVSLEVILDSIDKDLEIILPPEEQIEAQAERNIAIPGAVVPAGDANIITVGLIKFSIKNNLTSIREAVRMFGLDEYNDQSFSSLLPESTKNLLIPLIEDGKYFCACCNKIPLNPNLHHVVPKSRGHGYGPLALLCEEPCHLTTVQSRHKHFASRVWKFNLKEIYEEIDSFLDSGQEVPQAPIEKYGIVTGELGHDV